MTTLVEQVRTAAGARARTIVEPSALRHIHDPEIDLVTWDRGQNTATDQWLDHLQLDKLPAFRAASIALADLDAALLQHTADTPALGADIAELARRYALLLGLNRVRIRLETVTTDACRYFHVDRVRLRLLTTYIGPGIDWLDTGADPEQRIRRLPDRAVAVLKGALWPDSPGCPHRSPPIAGTGHHRLLLSVDEGPGR